MEKMLTENDFWLSVMNTSANWVIAGAMFLQTVIFYVTFRLGFKELEKHKQKLKIEREHRFAEKMIELIFEIDSQMNDLFKEKILDTPDWKQEAKRIDEITDVFTLLGYPQIRYFYRRHLAVKANKEVVWGRITALSKELSLYIGYFGARRFMERKSRMIFAAKGLVDWTVDSFPKLMSEERESTDEFIDYFFNTLVPKFPDTMYTQTPYVKSYEKYRDDLTDMVFKILKE